MAPLARSSLVIAIWSIVGQGGDELIQYLGVFQSSRALVAVLVLAAAWRLAGAAAPAPAYEA